MAKHSDVSPPSPEKATKQPFNREKLLVAIAKVDSRESLERLAKEAERHFDEEWGCDPTLPTEWMFSKAG